MSWLETGATEVMGVWGWGKQKGSNSEMANLVPSPGVSNPLVAGLTSLPEGEAVPVASVKLEVRSLDSGTNFWNETVFCNLKKPQDFAVFPNWDQRNQVSCYCYPESREELSAWSILQRNHGRTELKMLWSWYVLVKITSYIVLKTKVPTSTTCQWTVGDLLFLNKKMFVTVRQCWQRWGPARDGFSRRPLFSTALLVSQTLSSDSPPNGAKQSIHVPV